MIFDFKDGLWLMHMVINIPAPLRKVIIKPARKHKRDAQVHMRC